jgi:hypothetical protein
MRRSTGQLCVDLTPSGNFDPILPTRRTLAPLERAVRFKHSNSEVIAIESLEIEQYHRLCYWHLRQTLDLLFLAEAELNLGAVIHSPSGSEVDNSVAVALISLTDIDMDLFGWDSNTAAKEIMKDGWTR